MDSGFQIDYEIKSVSNEKLGKGIFTKTKIYTNTIIWKYVPNVNCDVYKGEVALRNHLKSLSREKAIHWIKHCFLSKHCDDVEISANEILDDGAFWNHSDDANCVTKEDGSCYAKRDIQIGEELTDNYGK